jgi:hypothetical protein
MTDHPCNGMTKAQRATFERIAISQPPYAGERTLTALLARGVVERVHRESRDPISGFTFSWWEYHVPLPVHMQWCEWCSEQPENVLD